MKQAFVCENISYKNAILMLTYVSNSLAVSLFVLAKILCVPLSDLENVFFGNFGNVAPIYFLPEQSTTLLDVTKIRFNLQNVNNYLHRR